MEIYLNEEETRMFDETKKIKDLESKDAVAYILRNKELPQVIFILDCDYSSLKNGAKNGSRLIVSDFEVLYDAKGNYPKMDPRVWVNLKDEKSLKEKGIVKAGSVVHD